VREACVDQDLVGGHALGVREVLADEKNFYVWKKNVSTQG